MMEVLVVVAVTGILLTIAVPAMTATRDSIKLEVVSDAFLSGMYLARAEAISRTSTVVLCKSSNGESCNLTGGWEQGWIVFRDDNSNGQRDDSEVIVAHEGALAGFKLTGNATLTKYVSFTPTGAAKLVSGGFQAGTLTLCKYSSSAGQARQIVLNVAGRVRVHKTELQRCE